MTETWPVVMVTGHRKCPKDCPEDWVRDDLAYVAAKLRDGHGTTTAISGMALFVDQVWAAVALDAGLRLHAAVPYPGQSHDIAAPVSQAWSDAQRAHYDELLAAASETTYVSERDPKSSAERVRLLHARNDWMLARADVVVGVWDPRNAWSGTASCLRKAAGAGLPIILLDMQTQKITMPRPEHWARRLNMPTLVRR